MTIKEFEEKYGLKVKNAKEQYKNKVEIIIGGDENDGDYIYEHSVFNVDDFQNYVPVLKALYFNKVSNNGDVMTQEEYKYLKENNIDGIFSEITPHGPYGCTSLWIEKITFFDENGNSYEVEINFKDDKE